MSDLAVLVMAYNEDDVLPRCLDSVSGLGELHVSIDRATTDESAAVARRYTENLYAHQGLPETPPAQDHLEGAKALNSYSRMRNEFLEAVCARSRADWFLWLDADEAVEEGGPDLLAFLPRVQPAIEAVAVRMLLYTPEGGLESVMRNSKVIRRTVRFTRRRHEHIVLSGPEAAQAQCEACAVAHRPTQRPETRAQHDRRKGHQEAFAADWQEHQDGRAAFYMGDWWRTNGHFEEALAWWERGLALPPERCIPLQRAQMATYAGKLCLALARLPNGLARADQARALFFRAYEIDWRYCESMYWLGYLAANRQQLDEAEHWFRLALTCPPVPQSIMQQDTGCTTDLPLYGLACVAHVRKQREAAYRFLDQAERASEWERAEFGELRRKLDED